jgi:hypothetical protein
VENHTATESPVFIVDVGFDVRLDTPAGEDPDALSETLRTYHRVLWGRPLPNGSPFELDASWPIRSRYLYHSSELGEFFLSSDSVMPSFTRWKRMQEIMNQFPEEEHEAFRTLGYTIGAMMIWPANRTPGQRLTINGLRGFSPQICDRMDLTLECVRRHYLGMDNPLASVLISNRAYFDLFGDFNGFVQHFLLQDLVSDDGSDILFFSPFNDFTGPARPTTVDEYRRYRERSIAFINKRNERIRRHCLTCVAPDVSKA